MKEYKSVWSILFDLCLYLAVILILAFAAIGAQGCCYQDVCIRVETDPRPRPTPTEEPTASPEPTATPTEVPTAAPTSTPTPLPTATPTATPVLSCTAVERTPHHMAPGDRCHAWNPIRDQDGKIVEIRCLVDSTIRPICDEDHMENWRSFCGERTHDPDYSKPDGTMEWFISGAVDEGPNKKNYAQRWIRFVPGTEVSVTVCIPANKRTPDGCLIIRQGDGCGSRIVKQPEL